jgi:hypothetical protein
MEFWRSSMSIVINFKLLVVYTCGWLIGGFTLIHLFFRKYGVDGYVWGCSLLGLCFIDVGTLDLEFSS